VTVVRDAAALAAMEEPLIILSTELASAPAMYIFLAQGCLFPHELVHQMASACVGMVRREMLQRGGGRARLPPLRFAFKQDTVWLRRAARSRGGSLRTCGGGGASPGVRRAGLEARAAGGELPALGCVGFAPVAARCALCVMRGSS
jgi:hypothetical protein